MDGAIWAVRPGVACPSGRRYRHRFPGVIGSGDEPCADWRYPPGRGHGFAGHIWISVAQGAEDGYAEYRPTWAGVRQPAGLRTAFCGNNLLVIPPGNLIYATDIPAAVTSRPASPDRTRPARQGERGLPARGPRRNEL